MNTLDLKTQLSAVRDQVRTTTKPSNVIAELHDGDWGAESWVRFSAPGNERIHFSNVAHLFSVLRDAIRLASGDSSWSIRYASQLKNDNMPFLHCGSRRVIIIDPMLPYRSPMREFYATRQFLWYVLPSQSYYFKSVQEVQEVADRQSTMDALYKAAEDDGGAEHE